MGLQGCVGKAHSKMKGFCSTFVPTKGRKNKTVKCVFLSYLFRQKGTQKTFLLNGLCHRTVFLQQHNPCRCMLLTPYVAQARASVKIIRLHRPGKLCCCTPLIKMAADALSHAKFFLAVVSFFICDCFLRVCFSRDKSFSQRVRLLFRSRDLCSLLILFYGLGEWARKTKAYSGRVKSRRCWVCGLAKRIRK